MPEGWEAATTFHSLQRRLHGPLRRLAEDRAVDAVVARARALLRHAARPVRAVEDGWPAPGELDLDATLERPRPWAPADLRVRRAEPREADVVAILDMSLSMTGEKIALIAVSAAILHLRLGDVGVVQFDSEAHTLVQVGEVVSTRELVRRVLTVPAQGYTHIEAGLKAGLEQLRRGRRRERVGVILTDGVANLGWDPARVAPRFQRLHVVQVGSEDRQGTRTCARMARAGRGRRYRAIIYAQLPAVVRRLIRECLSA